MIEPDDEVRALVRCSQNDFSTTTTMVLTPTRLLWTRHGVLAGTKSGALPLAEVERVTAYENGIAFIGANAPPRFTYLVDYDQWDFLALVKELRLALEPAERRSKLDRQREANLRVLSRLSSASARPRSVHAARSDLYGDEQVLRITACRHSSGAQPAVAAATSALLVLTSDRLVHYHEGARRAGSTTMPWKRTAGATVEKIPAGVTLRTRGFGIHHYTELAGGEADELVAEIGGRLLKQSA